MTREDRIIYEAYLKTDEWKKKRIAKAEEQNYKCERCGRIVLSGYHIHHKTYKNFMNEPLSDLQFLCEDCHKIIHREIDEERKYGIKPKKSTTTKNKPKSKADVKSCNTCKYSTCVKYTGSNPRFVLYCNLTCSECGKMCKRYKRGSYKEGKSRYWKKKR